MTTARALLLSAALLLALPPGAFAGRKGHGRSGYHYTAPHYSAPHSSHKAVGVPRTSKGKIKRSSSARSAFMHRNPCPSTGKTSGACPGYVVDHIKPLKRGGADAPSNMQWQTKDAAKAKDKWE